MDVDRVEEVVALERPEPRLVRARTVAVRGMSRSRAISPT